MLFAHDLLVSQGYASCDIFAIVFYLAVKSAKRESEKVSALVAYVGYAIVFCYPNAPLGGFGIWRNEREKRVNVKVKYEKNVLTIQVCWFFHETPNKKSFSTIYSR